MAGAVVEKITIEGDSRGLDTLANDLNDVARAQDRVAASNQDMTVVTERSGKSVRSLEGAFNRMLRSVDPTAKAAQGLARDMALADRAFQQLNVDAAEQARVLSLIETRWGQTTKVMDSANDNVRLASHQVSNLRSQLIDMGTMLAGGASPFQILSSQAGQIYEALAGQNGLKAGLRELAGSMKAAFAGLVAAVGPVALGLTAAAAVATGLWYVFRSKVVPLADALTSHKEALGAVAAAYGTAANEAANFQKAASGVAAFNVRQSRAQLELAARTSLNDNFVPGLLSDVRGRSVYQQGLADNGKVITEVSKQYAAFEAPVLKLVEGLEKGTARADVFVDEIAKIANMDPANVELQKAAKRLMDMASAAAEAQRQMAGLGTAFSKFAQSTKQFNDLAGDLGQFIPNGLTSEQQIEQTYQQMMRLAKTEADITRAQDLRRLSLEALAEAETRRRDGYELDVRSVTARSAADRAQIEYERTYADVLESTNDKAAASRQAEEARNLSLKQSNYELTEAMNERVRAGQQQVAQAQFELDTFGKSAGEIARLTAETQMLTAAREAARQAGGVVDLAEEQAIREQAAAIGELTDRMTRLNLERDQTDAMQQLRDEASVLHLNDDARRVVLAGLEAERQLRREGISANDAWGASYVQNARDMATMENALDKQQEAFDDLKDAVGGFFEALGDGEGILDALTGAFARFGQQLAQKGFDKLFGSMFGDGGSAASTIAQIGSAATQAANQNAPNYNATLPTERTFAAPVAAVERRVLPALTNFSTELTAAAKAIRTIESGSAAGNYSAQGPVTRNGDRALGAYQVMSQNLPQWTKAAIGRVVSNVEFLGSRDIQDAVFEHRFGGYMRKYGAEGASRAWFAGEGGMKNFRAQDVVGTSVGGYGSRFGQLYGQFSNGPATSSQERAYERATERGVERGVTRALPQIDGGYGGTGGGVPVPTARPGGSSGLFSQNALSIFGAAAGAFSGGAQSGSALGALVSGGFTGLGAAPAIASALPGLAGIAGPLSAVGGAAISLIGNIFAKRAERKAAHKEAAAKWEQMRPQYEAFDASLSGDTKGGLRTWVTEQWNQLSGFMATGGAAWKSGQGNSTAQFRSTGTKLFERFHEMIREFQDGYVSMIHDMESGEGLQGAFAKGRNATKDLKKQIQATRDDIDIAFGNVADIGFLNTPDAVAQAKATEEARSIAIERYNKAAGEYALSLMYTSVQVSDVRKTIDGFRGTAAGLHDVFADLGWSAEDAAAAINDRLNQAIANVAKGLNEGIRDRIEELAGVGYFSSVRSFLAEFDTLKADVAAAGADPSQLNDLFGRELQAIVDGAELTGTAFTDLIAMFPQLSGVVREFANTIERTAEQLADAIQGYDDRAFAAVNDNTTLAGALAEFERKAAADRKAEALAGNGAIVDLERALAAERAKIEGDFARTAREAMQTLASNRYEAAVNARGEAESALRAEYERTVDYVDGIRGYLSDMRLDDNLSTLSGKEQFDEAQRLYRETLFKANGGDQDAQDKLLGVTQDYLDEAKAYYATSEKYGEVYAEIEATLKATATRAETELDVAKRQAGSLLDIAENTKGLLARVDEWLSSNAAVNKAASGIDASRDWGIRPVANRKNVAEFRAAGLPEYMGNFGPGAARAAEMNAWLSTLSPSQYAQALAIMTANNAIGYATGGYTGAGGMHEPAGIVHRGEVVWSQPDVARWGGPGNVEAMRTSVPPITMPTMPRVSGSNDNGAVVQAIGRLADIMDRVVIAVAGSGEAVREEVAAGAAETRAIAKELKVANGRPR